MENGVIYTASKKEFLAISVKDNKKTVLKHVGRYCEIADLKYENLNLAYEPIWAIGTGRSAKIGDISEVLDFLRTFTDIPLLYGGSVNLSNISEILSVKNCDGVLVGSASLDVNNFINLINYKKG